MKHRPIAPGRGSRHSPDGALRSRATVAVLCCLIATAGGVRVEAAETIGGWRSSMTGGFKAFAKAIGGASKKDPPKQAARLPIPPDAHDDDAIVSQTLKPPIAEAVPIGPPSSAGPTKSGKPAGATKRTTTSGTVRPGATPAPAETATSKRPQSAKFRPESTPAERPTARQPDVDRPTQRQPQPLSAALRLESALLQPVTTEDPPRPERTQVAAQATVAESIPQIRSVGDIALLASAFGETAKAIVAASLDPAYEPEKTRSAPSKPTVRLAAKPALDGNAKPAVDATAKPAVDATAKPAVDATAKPAVDGNAKPAAASPAKPPMKREPPKTTAATKAEQKVAETDEPAAKRLPGTAWTTEGSAVAPPVNTRMTRLRRRIEQVLASYKRRPLNTQEHTPWEVMHSFLAYGIATDVRVGGPRGGLVNAIGWINSGGRCRGQSMLATQDDQIMAVKGVGVQGHSAQYLAVLAQCRVAADSPLTPQRRSFTVRDLIEREKLDCRSKTELTFALIALAHYLPTDATWTASDGQPWSLERLVAEELEQPIRGAPCGGTHRLFGLAYGCQRRLRATGSLEGVYERADAFVREYQLMTLTKLQNPDGSFSTEWYKFPTAQNREDDIDRKVQTTGHMLEWLVASLDQESLYHSRVTRAVEFLAAALASDPTREWSVGPMCHALHALSVYQERVWGVVLPGAVAAFKGPMKAVPEAAAQVAEASEAKDDSRGTATGNGAKRPVRR